MQERVILYLNKGLAENWLNLLFYARCKNKTFLRKFQLVFFFCSFWKREVEKELLLNEKQTNKQK